MSHDLASGCEALVPSLLQAQRRPSTRGDGANLFPKARMLRQRGQPQEADRRDRVVLAIGSDPFAAKRSSSTTPAPAPRRTTTWRQRWNGSDPARTRPSNRCLMAIAASGNESVTTRSRRRDGSTI